MGVRFGAQLSSEIGSLRMEVGSVRSELTGEIGSLRTEVAGEIGALRVEFAHHLTRQGDLFRGELADFRHEFIVFRDDVLTHFDTIYGRLDWQASEYQALRLAVERLERHPPSA